MVNSKALSQALGQDFYSGRNKIINGAMEIDQRNGGAIFSAPADSSYVLDRWKTQTSGGGVYSVQQSTTVPPGFKNSMVLTVTTPDSSIAAGDYYNVTQSIEGVNCVDLDFGLSTAKTITLSFWVRSSVTGTYGGSIRNSSVNRCYPFQYSISVANTWTQISIVIPGDTTGTWLTNTSNGLLVTFDMGTGVTYQGPANAWSGAGNYITATGSTQWIATNAATWYITGVQVEAGSIATPFERRNYGTEYALCQRYYETIRQDAYSATFLSNSYVPDGSTYSRWYFKVTKRANPTFSILNGATWTGITPATSCQVDQIGFYGTNISFYLSGSTGVINASATAEL